MYFYRHLLRKYKMYSYLNNIVLFRRYFAFSLPRQVGNIQQCEFMQRKTYSLDTTKGYEEPFGDQILLSSSDDTRTILFNDFNPLSLELEKCASVEEVFKFVKEYHSKLDCRHLAQIVFALLELQTIFHQLDTDNESKKLFLSKLMEHKEFEMVLDGIQNQLGKFDKLFLSYTILHLHELGVSEQSEIIQNAALRLRDMLLEDFSLSETCRLLTVIFSENSVRPIMIVINLIPEIFKQIELVDNTNSLSCLITSLHKLQMVVTDDILQTLKDKFNDLLVAGVVTPAKDYHLVLKFISLLNYPKWRNINTTLISKYILMIENSIELMSFSKILMLYDIFFKNQEPGDAMNTIQRSAAKLLHETDYDTRKKLKLFSSLIYFSSPINKEQFRQQIGDYVHENETLSNLIVLRKIYSYLKMFDKKLWNHYWTQACHVLKVEEFDQSVRLFENYMYFSLDMPGFRHYTFEHYAMTLIEKQLNAGTLTIQPSKFFSVFDLVLACCQNEILLKKIINKFDNLVRQATALDVYKMSHSLHLAEQNKNISSEQAKQIKQQLNEQTERLYYAAPQDDIHIGGLLVKGAIIRKDSHQELVDDMLINIKSSTQMSSKLLEYICYNLFTTKALIPEVINNCTNYVLKYKSHIVGFNAEKLLQLLYQLNYQPVFEDKFFKAVIDIIIRDQERLSGLSFLYSALILCFFNKIPRTFVRQIFNVEFLDKLDVELANCYFRDKYPLRVRHILMQLNRAVCLEYPEYNVPWFHQKYIEEYQKTNAIDDIGCSYSRSVKTYLKGILGPNNLIENVTTPYGYNVNFVYHLDTNNEPTDKFDDPCTQKFALLLKYEEDFTRLYVHLKGEHVLKNRHLELLGYKVKIIPKNQWDNLLYSEERVEYVKKIIFS